MWSKPISWKNNQLVFSFFAVLLLAMLLNCSYLYVSGKGLYSVLLSTFSYGIACLVFWFWNADKKNNGYFLVGISIVVILIQLLKNPVEASLLFLPDQHIKHVNLKDFYDSFLHLPGQFGLAIFSPTIPLLLLIFWAIKTSPKIFFTAFAYFFVIFYLGRLAFPAPTAAIDNALYIEYANKVHGIWGAITGRHFNTSPVSEMLYLGQRIFQQIASATAFLHAIYVSVILTVALKLFEIDFKSRVVLKVWILCNLVLIASPVMPIMAIMINKDFVVTFCLFTSLYMGKMLLRSFSDPRRQVWSIISHGALLIFSILVIFCARPQLFYFFMVSLGFLGGYKFLEKKHFSLLVRSGIIFVGISFFMAALLYWKWQAIRIEIPYFFDGTNIADFHFIDFARGPVNFFMAYAYVFVGWFFALFGSFVNLALHVSLVHVAVANIFFLMMLIFYVQQKNSSSLKAWYCIFFAIHLSIQIWATPNAWIFMRQTLFEFFFLMVYTYGVLIKNVPLRIASNIK